MAKKTAKTEAVKPPEPEAKPTPQSKRIARATPKPVEVVPEPVVVKAPVPPALPKPKVPKPKRPRFVRAPAEKRPETGVVNDLVRSKKPAGKLLTKNLKLAPEVNDRGHHDPRKTFG